MTMIERLRRNAYESGQFEICPELVLDAARALEAADAAISALSRLASAHQWTEHQIQALAAYRAATKGEG